MDRGYSLQSVAYLGSGGEENQSHDSTQLHKVIKLGLFF